MEQRGLIAKPRPKFPSPEVGPCPPSPAAPLPASTATCLHLPSLHESWILGDGHNSSWLANWLNQLIFCFHQICSLGTHTLQCHEKNQGFLEDTQSWLRTHPASFSSYLCSTQANSVWWASQSSLRGSCGLLSAIPLHFPKSLWRSCEKRFW